MGQEFVDLADGVVWELGEDGEEVLEGVVANISKLFIEFQAHLYQQDAA